MPQLRSFASFGATAPVVLFTHPVDLVNLDGTAAGVGYLQIFDLAVAPTTTVTVPLKSIQITAAGPMPSLYEALGPVHLLNGLAIAFSSTDQLYTAVGTNYSVFGEVEEFEIDNTIGATVVGDTTTGVDHLDVWANTAATQGLNSLRKIEVSNGSAANRYLMVFAHSPSAGDKPLLVIKVPYNTTNVVPYSFGTSGFVPFAKTAAGVLRNGCFLYASTTADVFTADTGTGWTIKAWYV